MRVAIFVAALAVASGLAVDEEGEVGAPVVREDDVEAIARGLAELRAELKERSLGHVDGEEISERDVDEEAWWLHLANNPNLVMSFLSAFLTSALNSKDPVGALKKKFSFLRLLKSKQPSSS